MTKLLVFVVGASLTNACLAQDLLECVDPDIRESLLWRGYGGPMTVEPSMPAVLTGLRVPTEFQFLASSVSDVQTIAAFKTALQPSSAADAAVAALVSAGWQSETAMMPPQRGFRLDSQPLMAMVCDENHRVTVTARESQNAVYVTLSAMQVQGNFSCGLEQPTGRGLQMYSLLQQYMPTLRVPDGSRDARSNAAMGLAASGSGGDREISQTVSITSELTLGSLADHFDGQVREQGWLYDSSWAGALSAGSVWSLHPNADTNLVGMLELVSVDDSLYRVGFRVIAVE
jgi:hypothetical protein